MSKHTAKRKEDNTYSQQKERQHIQPAGRKTTHIAKRKEDNTMKRHPVNERKYIRERANF